MSDIIRGPPVDVVRDARLMCPDDILAFKCGLYVLAFDEDARILATVTRYPLQEDRYIVLHLEWWNDNLATLRLLVSRRIRFFH